MCDTVVVVEPGRVLFAKNSDRDANEAQLLTWQPRREHERGATLKTTWIEIPQVAQTNAVLLSRPFWMWGAEIGANEHGVVIGNEAVFTTQPMADVGLLGMDLLRLALERASSASAAVDVICELLERHGQGRRCGLEDPGFRYHNSFIVADAAGAFVVETADRKVATERVDGVRSISNELSLPGFADEHRKALETWACSSRTRRERTTQLGEKAHDAADMMALLADHGDGNDRPSYSWFNGTLGAPCMHGGGLVASSVSTASWVSVLSDAANPAHWVTGTAAPDLSLFKPVRVDEPLDLGSPATDRRDDKSLWWRHEALHRRVLADYPAAIGLFADDRRETQKRWLENPPEPAAAFAEADVLLERWIAKVTELPQCDRRPLWARRYWAKRDEWARAGRGGDELLATALWCAKETKA